MGEVAVGLGESSWNRTRRWGRHTGGSRSRRTTRTTRPSSTTGPATLLPPPPRPTRPITPEITVKGPALISPVGPRATGSLYCLFPLSLFLPGPYIKPSAIDGDRCGKFLSPYPESRMSRDWMEECDVYIQGMFYAFECRLYIFYTGDAHRMAKSGMVRKKYSRLVYAVFITFFCIRTGKLYGR